MGEKNKNKNTQMEKKTEQSSKPLLWTSTNQWLKDSTLAYELLLNTMFQRQNFYQQPR